MNNKLKKLTGDTAIFAIGNFGSKLILFFLVPLYTNCLSTSEYGTVDFIETVAWLAAPSFFLVIYEAILRFALAKDETRENVIKNALLVFFIGSLITLLSTPLFGLYPLLSPWKWYLCAYIIAWMGYQIVMVYIRAKELMRLFAILGILNVALLAFINIVFLLVFDLGIKGYLMANFFAHILVLIVGLILGRVVGDIVKGKFEKRLLIQMLKYSAPLIINNVSWWVVQSSDKVMIEMMIGVSALGSYTVAGKIPALINVLTSVFSQAWGVSSIKEFDGDKDSQFFSVVFEFLVFVVSFACAAAIMISKTLMHYYVSEEFFLAWVFIPLLLVAAGFSAISFYFGAIYGALKKSVNVMLSTLLSALINIFLNLLLIKQMGVMGAVVATATAYVFVALYRLFDTRRYFKFSISFSKFVLCFVAVSVQAIFVSNEIIFIPSLLALTLIVFVNRSFLNKACRIIITRGD